MLPSRKIISSCTKRIASNGRIVAPRSVARAATVTPFVNYDHGLPPSNCYGVSYYHHHSKLSNLAGFGLSSIAEPNPTLFRGGDDTDNGTVASKPDGSGDDNKQHAQLRADVRTMGSLLGQIIQDNEGDDIFNKVEELRNLAKTWRDAGAGRSDEDLATDQQLANETFDKMSSFVSSLSNDELFLVSRAFTHFLAIANAAEGHHRSRNIQDRLNTIASASSGYDGHNVHALTDKEDSVGGVIPTLVDLGYDAETIYNTITSQVVELVLTAHPTEVNRRTILDKQRRVQQILTKADKLRAQGATPYQEMQLNNSLRREISSIWQSDEVSRAKPTPQNEAERGTLFVETVLWETLPRFLRKLDATMVGSIGKGLPLDKAPIKFASWMGGDRDGNPNVTPPVTREVCLTNRVKASTLLRSDLLHLWAELSINNCSPELEKALGASDDIIREPYRHYLKSIIKKLDKTIEWAQEELDHVKKGATGGHATISTNEVYLDKDDIMSELLLVYRSLSETGNQITADGRLTDIIRNLASFGLTLVPLDVRQESDRHTEALDCMTRFLGLGSYEQWDENTRISWLQQQLVSNRPLMRPGDWHLHPDMFTPTTVDTLETFQMISEQHDDSLGAYVISQATTASDVLAVLLLQRDAGVKNPLRVVPLFETLDDLNGATDTMRSLFSLPAYVGSIGGKQEVMIGYSDSAKDAGRLAASWAQYETQEKLAAVAKEFGIEMTFFHGKGGTVGRGGNPATFKAILAHAPDTINGRFRVTEQGEMINQNFGHGDRAERTMDIYTAAVLAEKLKERAKPTKEWRDMMNQISDMSCAAYRKVVREDERFVPYFRSATPELELSNLNIGSRPAKRKATGGVESLRAIPWNFSWTQTRLNLPTWLGVGESLSTILNSPDADKLRDMYNQWDSFRTTIDLVEMVLAKSEPAIAKHYDTVLVSDPKAQELGQEVRSLHTETEQAVLNLSQHKVLSEDNKVLRRALSVRNPYVDCLNVLQTETLKRLRSCEEGKEDQVLKDALLTNITGVANGMGNTG